MSEIWKDIEGYEGHYQVSNLGRVGSYYNNRWLTQNLNILQPHVNKLNYCYVNLRENGKYKHKLVHRLVAKAFVGGYFNGAVVNHIDHNPLNNVYTNLEWTTQKDNTSREKSFSSSRLSKGVLQLDLNGVFIKRWISLMHVEEGLGFDNRNVYRAIKNGSTAYGYRWARP